MRNRSEAELLASQSLDVDEAVRSRYSGAARSPEASLCCPISYDPALLRAVPPEVLKRDYGCGDPTRHLEAGEVVLDLGSGQGRHASSPRRWSGRPAG
jgi:arsenite methyltransferase